MLEPARVLYVIATLDPHGAERQMVTLATHLDRERFEPTVCALTRGGPLEEELADAGVETTILGKKHKLDVAAVWRLRRLIRARQIDLVHTWLFTSNAFGRIAALSAGGCRIVASERSVDRWRSFVHVRVDRFLARCTDRILANAQAVKQFLIEHEGLRADKIEIIPNGFDASRFQGVKPAALRRELGLPDDAVLIGCIARLEEQKGIPYLVRAAKELAERIPRAAFLIAGSGPGETSLRDLVHELGLTGRVRLLGHREDVPAVLAALDVFVLPSLWEGLPNVVLEAMASRLPVVATGVDGTRDLVADGANGLLVPPEDAQSLANAIARVIESPDLARDLADAGHAAAQDYTIERMVERTQQVYGRVLRSAPSR